MATERPLTLSATLTRGASGPEVSRVQELLNLAGSRPRIRADGRFGPATEQSVRCFQSTHAIGVDGRVGSLTWRALERAAGPVPAAAAETPAGRVVDEAAAEGAGHEAAGHKDVGPSAGSPGGEAYSPAFKAFMPFIFEWEGERYENDPDDPGGATKFGIDQRSHPGLNIRALTKQAATAIYWDEWLHGGCDKMGSPFAEVYFNCCVNMGGGRAKQFAAGAKGSAKTFLDLQEARYRSIAAGSRKLRKFLKGWLNRTTALRQRFGL